MLTKYGASGLFCQKNCFSRSFNTIAKKRKGYANPMAMRSGIVQQLFSETYASEKKLIRLGHILHERR